MTSVLLVSDQNSGKFPDRCVLTGEKTKTAVHVWALETTKAQWLIGFLGYLGVVACKVAGRRVARIAVPITERPWGIWKRRANLSIAATAAGTGLALAGLLRASIGLAIFGLVIVAAARLLRLRAHQNYWISTELRPQAGHILVGPTHPDFDRQARMLFEQRL